jgi:hypothetical protein
MPTYPPQIPTPAPANPFNNSKWVVLYAYVRLPTDAGGIVIGSDGEFVLESLPAILQAAPPPYASRAWANGSQPWVGHNVAQMRTCFSFNAPCIPDGPWVAFRPSVEAAFAGGFRQGHRFHVDWIGAHALWIGAQYQDDMGNPVKVVDGDHSDVISRGPAEVLQTRRDVIGVWDEATPFAAQPPVVRTLIAATRIASEMTGSVDIGPGLGAMGGAAGETISARVLFTAASPYGRVTDMRIAGGCSLEAVQSAGWEPFVPEKAYPIYVPINWTSFSIAVQYRDDKGNISQLYCDDIGVEGMPPTPEPIPAGWLEGLSCFSEAEVRPGPGETITCDNVLFAWPGRNILPENLLYQVDAFDAETGASVASGTTRETSLALPIPHEYAGDLIWYVSLYSEAFGAVSHSRCSSVPWSLLSVLTPGPIPGVSFHYQP